MLNRLNHQQSACIGRSEMLRVNLKPRQSSSPQLHTPALGGAATIMGNGSNISNQGDFDARRLQSPNGRFPAGTRPGNHHLGLAHPLLSRPAGGLLGCGLGSKGRTFLRPFEPTRSR
jgi:hypothetical protein